MEKAAIRSIFAMCLVGAFLPVMAEKWGENEPDTADFTLVKSAEGIALYERWYPIEENLSAREVKAIFTVRAYPDAALALLKDGSRGRLWNKNTNAYEVVDISDNEWVSYMEYDLPWPINNQDCVLQYNVTQVDDAVVVSFQTTEHADFPERNRVERIPDIRGKWVLRQVADALHIEYYISTRPSKTLPGWLTDPIIRSNLIETVGAFRAMLEER